MYNQKCYNCKNGRYMTSTGLIICHGFTLPQRADDIIKENENFCPEYELDENWNSFNRRI
ncbi:Uncharacterised protein [[Clostridium] sordellii]|uniref:hypothetical protein n=1 Tax=Paraclostridium sordellii TaxID=1505 RepID=UPI0005E2A6C7|nr:hypothetical protein [Paeniclostridium sordellii]CEQ01662.1 Uncharacterised protein [[Clostridium] sordellii] [Paeniclostridium sordellii]